MDVLKGIIDLLGYIGAAIGIVVGAITIVAWARGIAPVLWRLGIGLSRRQIAIFARADNAATLEKALIDSGLFRKRNILIITQKADVVSGQEITLFLLHWKDAGAYVDEVLNIKKDKCFLVVYAPTDEGRIPESELAKLASHRNTTVTNFRGRLLSDVVVAMITTSYSKD